MPIRLNMQTTAILTYAHVMWDTQGVVGQWTGQVTRTMVAEVRTHTPVNKRAVKWEDEGPIGALQASIRGKSSRFSPLGREIQISANTHYAFFVHEGTRPVITPVVSAHLHLPPNRINYRKKGGTFGSSLKSVSGQRPQPFLRDGYEACRLIYPELPHL